VKALAAPTTWLGRAAFAVLGLAIAVLAFFFLAVAVVVGGVIALVVGVRFWWLVRKVKTARAASGPIEGEYKVVDRDRLR
jgi:hypothetical protein